MKDRWSLFGDRLVSGTIMLGVLVGLSGCVKPFRDLIGGADARAGEFEAVQAKFHRDLYWRNYADAFEVVVPGANRTQLLERLGQNKSEKVANIEVKNTTFGEDNRSAEVDVAFRFFRPGKNLVETLTRREQWKYGALDGWQLVDAHALGDSTPLSDGETFTAGAGH